MLCKHDKETKITSAKLWHYTTAVTRIFWYIENNYNFYSCYSITKLTYSFSLGLWLEAQEGHYSINYLSIIPYCQINASYIIFLSIKWKSHKISFIAHPVKTTKNILYCFLNFKKERPRMKFSCFKNNKKIPQY